MFDGRCPCLLPAEDVQGFGIGDYFIVVAMTLGLCGDDGLGQGRFGKHIVIIEEGNLVMAVLLNNISSL